ncbi:unnamed protein product [Didymodactylos carnosus]|nr:unnamed protein product [Didymodactylos carnosus]
MDSGSNVDITFYYGDVKSDDISTSTTCYYAGDYPTGRPLNQCTPSSHIFLKPGNITVITKFSNPLNTIYRYTTIVVTTSVNPIQVVTSIGSVVASSCIAAYVNNLALANFVIQSQDLTSKPASNAYVIITPDSTQPNQTQGPYSLTMDYDSSPARSVSGLTILYSQLGNYTALFNVKNNYDSVVINCTVQVVSVLQDVYYSIIPINWPLNSITSFKASVYIGDISPGSVTLSWNFGDGSPSITRNRTATQFYQADTEIHFYTAVGFYIMTITAINSVSSVTNNFQVYVQYAVKNFTVNVTGSGTLPSQIIYTQSPATLNFSVQDTSTPGASTAFIIIDFNDTTNSAIVNASLPYTASYTYNSFGIYYVNFTAYNRVSSVTQLTKVSINAPFTNLGIIVCYLLPTETSPLEDICTLVKRGSVSVVPKQSQLVIYASWSNSTGIPETFTLTLTNSSSYVYTIIYSVSQVTNMFTTVGITSGSSLYRIVFDLESNMNVTDDTYNVRVKVANPSYSSSVSQYIQVMTAIGGLSISDRNVINNINTQKIFYAVYTNFSQYSCLYIQYSDLTYECYGDPLSCSTLPSDIPALTPCSTTLLFNYTTPSTTVTFSRAFNQSQAFVYGYAWNAMTRTTQETYFSFPITGSLCNLPYITFDIHNPILRWARQVFRSESFSVIAYTALNCSLSLNNTKEWTIAQCNTTSGLCTSTKMLNNIVKGLSSSTTAEIYIPAMTLQYGSYQFKYTVYMNSKQTFLSYETTYIEVVQSPLVVNMLANGTSSITRGVAQDLVLNPGAWTIDPDSTFFASYNWSYDYYCRIYGQSNYPNLNGILFTIEDTRIDTMNPSCFASPGNETYKYGPGNNKSVVSIEAGALQSGHTYEFKATLTNIYNSDLQYSGYLLVQSQDINSVQVSISCIIKMCEPNVEYQRINPTTQVILTSTCVDGCSIAEDIKISWSVYQGFVTDYPNTDVKWVLYSNMTQYLETWFYGEDSTNFTATSALFVNNPNIIYWSFQAMYIVTDKNGILVGSGSIRFVINAPPVNGTCSIDLTSGTTSTVFTITSWTTDNTSRTTIGFTSQTSLQVRLPIGNPTLNLVAQIRDVYDAITEYSMPQVTVVADNVTIMTFLQRIQDDQQLDIDGGVIEQLLHGGDQRIASQVLLSISQMLNMMSLADEQLAIINIPVTGIMVAQLGASTISQNISNTTDTTAAMANYSSNLNLRATARDYVMQFIGNLSITNVDSINLQAAAVADLTEATTELSRQSSTLASNKCLQLSNALNNMAQTISVEDAFNAAKSIAVCTSNAITGANAPLLQRAEVLNLDYDRANMLPVDYETDLETVWSNPTLFADGDDFSWETIQKNRNIYYQQQTSNTITAQAQNSLSMLKNVLSYHLNIGQNIVINTSAVALSLQKVKSSNLTSITISQSDEARVTLPAINFCQTMTQVQNCTNSTPITLNSVMLPLALAGQNGRLITNTNLSTSVSLTLSDETGTTISISNLSVLIEIIIPREQNLSPSPMTYQNVTSITALQTSSANNNKQFFLHYTNITPSNINQTLSVSFEMQPVNLNLGYMLIMKFDGIPTLNSTKNMTDGWSILCPTNLILSATDGLIYSYFIDNTRTKDHLLAFFGIRELNNTELQTYCPTNGSAAPTGPPINDQAVNFSSNYEVRIYTSGCYYLDVNSNWQSSGLTVGPQTSHTLTHCYSNHLTTFAGGWVVLPAPINWNYVFANADFSRNKTIYLTVILTVVLYLIILIYARYKDKKDVEKLGVTPLPDNLTADIYYYQIIVFTGLRKDAGTKSKVHFIISGDDDETGVRTLEDPNRTILQRGGIDAFVMSVPKSLGQLNYIRIWHDNTGKGTSASWFLKYIVVRDLQTMEKQHFICQQWLAVEKDDGSVDRLLPVAGEAQKTEFAYLMSKKTYQNMSDGHLWFSVFSRPPSTRFTRFQRCTCCFVLLFMSMLMNIMYYDQTQESKKTTSGGLSIGPFYVTPEQIGIGVMVELICFLPSTLLVELFRRSRRRKKRPSPVTEAIKKIQRPQQQQKHTRLTDVNPQLTNYVINPNLILSTKELDVMRTNLASPLPVIVNTDQKYGVPKKKQKRTFPWWCIIIAYLISFFLVGISAVFIIARGIEFGDLKTQKWLTSLISGFFTSILLTQPIKVVCFAIFFALVIRKDDDELLIEDEEEMLLGDDEEYMNIDTSLLSIRSKTGYIPLNEAEIMDAREKRLKEIKMWDIIREIIAYASFLWILYVVSYSNRDPNGNLIVQHLRSYFLNIDVPYVDYTNIFEIEQFWYWLNQSFMSNIRAERWYNGDEPRNLTGYINDKTNRMIGWATMRQLRVKPNLCDVAKAFQNLIDDCEAGYSILNEDRRDFNPGWSLYNETFGAWSNYSSTVLNAFTYRTGSETDTYPYAGDHATYAGGGYLYEFRGKMIDMIQNITLLRDLSWIDKQTRAVFIKLNMYNPNVNIFIYVTFLLELLPTGGVFTEARFEPLTIMQINDGKFQISFQTKLICSILYMLFIVYYMMREIRLLIKMKTAYFREFWTYTEWGIIACSWSGMGVYFWRIYEGNRIGTLFAQTNGYIYIDLQLASYLNDVLTFLLGFCCFFGTIKFLRLLRFNRRMSILATTLQTAARDLLSFGFMFSIVFVAFLCLFYLLFVTTLWECSDFLKAAQMCFEMMLLKFNVSDLMRAGPILGPLCFSMFIVFVVFICMNMFISIINDYFKQVRSDIAKQSNEYEMMTFMINKFKKWTGIGRPNEMAQLHLNPFDGTRVHYHDQVSYFPQKIDELLIALNKIYIENRQNDPTSLPGKTLFKKQAVLPSIGENSTEKKRK